MRTWYMLQQGMCGQHDGCTHEVLSMPINTAAQFHLCTVQIVNGSALSRNEIPSCSSEPLLTVPSHPCTLHHSGRHPRPTDPARRRLTLALCTPGAGREPRRSWEQGRVSAELCANSTPEGRAATGPPPARTSQQRVSFDERAIANGVGSGRGGAAAVDSAQTLSDGPSSLSSAWPPLGSDRRSSGSGTIPSRHSVDWLCTLCG